MTEQVGQESKRLNNLAEVKIRLKWLVIGHVIFWVILGLMVLIFNDYNIAVAVNPGDGDESYWIYKVIKVLSDTLLVTQGGTLIVTILCLSIPKWAPYRRTMLEILYSLLFAGIFVESLKNLNRIRPFQDGSPVADAINPYSEDPDVGSMPSGHVGYTGAVILPHAVWIRNVVICVIISIYNASMLYVRMFLGVHYASDVLMGNIISIVSVVGSFLLFSKIYKDGPITRKKEWIIFGLWVVLFFGSQIILRAI